MFVQCKNGDVTFDTSATTATNADSIPVGTGELPGELDHLVSVKLLSAAVKRSTAARSAS